MKARFAALALLSLSLAAPALADTHIDNIEGISVRRDGTIDRFSGMVIDEEGRISELLDFGDRPTRDVEYRVDGEGRVVVPGSSMRTPTLWTSASARLCWTCR